VNHSHFAYSIFAVMFLLGASAHPLAFIFPAPDFVVILFHLKRVSSLYFVDQDQQ
jgi:hypothetical protein